MAVYYRYRSSVETFSVPVPASSISVRELKGLILAAGRHGRGRTRGRGPRESITLSDAQTGDEYTDDSALILLHSTVVVCRVAGPPAETILFGSSDPRRAVHYGGTPPDGYRCPKCRVPGHFIQRCPTNGDPRSPATESPVVLAPAPAAPVTAIRNDDGIPAELHCKICSNVMVDAVLMSKCCFVSFCDGCIRAHIVANSKCVCGALARVCDQIPNRTIRVMIANTLSKLGTAASCGTKKQKSSVCSNTIEPAKEPSEIKTPAAPSKESCIFSTNGAPSLSEQSDRSEGSTPKSETDPRRQQATTAYRAKTRPNHADRFTCNVPSDQECYNLFLGRTPWATGPSMYYAAGCMPYAYGGGYPMVATHIVHSMGGVPISNGNQGGRHGRKRTAECEDESHTNSRRFKRR